MQCSIGFGQGRACGDLAIGGHEVALSAADLPPRTPVTVRAAVDVPTPAQVTLPWPFTYDRILGRSVAAVGWMVGLTVAGVAVGGLW